MEEKLSTTVEVKINSDLLNAKDVLQVASMQSITFFTNMQEKYEELEKEYPNITFENKLLLTAFTLNLLVYSFQSKNLDRELYYYDKVQLYYKNVDEENVLNNFQRVNWSLTVAHAYSLIEYFDEAIENYQKAITLETTKLGHANSGTAIQRHLLLVVEIYLKRGIYFRTKDPAPELEYESYTKAIEATEHALNLPLSNLTSKVYYFQAQAKALLAACKYKQEQPETALKLLIAAMLANVSGLKITESPDNQKRYLKHITNCNKELLAIIGKMKNKKNSNVESEARKLNELIKQFNIQKLEILSQLIEKMNDLLITPVNPLQFWHTEQKSLQFSQDDDVFLNFQRS